MFAVTKTEWEALTVWLHDDQIRETFFCLWASEWKRELFLFSFLGQEQICVQHKGYVDKVEKNILVNGKSFAENNVKRILYFNWTTQWFNVSFIPYSFVSFEMIVCHFLGVFLARLYDCVLVSVNLLLFILKKHSCQLISWVQGTLWQLLLFYFVKFTAH